MSSDLTLSSDLKGRLIDALVEAIRDAAVELTELDQAIGDGDHGLNMKRGFDAVAELRDELAALSLPAALQKLGMTLVMKVGGASGPLYGSFFMALAKTSAEEPRSASDLAAMLKDGVAAVMKRGKSTAGEKTMLEVLVPVSDALAAAGDGADIAALLTKLRETADAGLESTRAMKATKGRASFLGDRSIGHLDPGARSSQLLIHAVCDVLSQNPKA